MSVDHNTAEYWQQRWQSGQTGWDMGVENPVLMHELSRGVLAEQQPHQKDILLPGCGSGYEIEALARAGWHVTAVDIASEPLQRIEARLKLEAPKVRQRVTLLHGDMLTLFEDSSQQFDCIWEYTCFCAIPPTLREDYARALFHVLKPGGILYFLFFPLGAKSQDGPPFTVSVEDDIAIFERLGMNASMRSHSKSHPKRASRELFAEFTKH